MDIEKYKRQINFMQKIYRKDKTMSVQVLSSDYISKVNPAQVEQWVKDGKVVRQNGQYYVANASSGEFPDSCFVKDTDGRVKVYQQDGKGVIVEKTTPKSNGEVVGTPQQSYNVNVSQVIERMGITDEALKTEFRKFLSNEKLSIADNGEISLSDVNQLNNALQKFANAHKANFVDANAQKYVEFTENSDLEVINNLKTGNNPAIEENPTTEGSRRYAVKNLDTLNASLSEQVGETTYESSDLRKGSIDAGITTTTTTREGIVDVPDNLRGSRAERKKLEKKAREAYADLVANADPETRSAINLYVAERKYGKQIDKKMQELSTYTSTLGSSKERKVKRDGADIIQYYIENYTNEKDKATLNQVIENVQNSTIEADQKNILKELRGANILSTSTNYDDLSPELKRKGALLSVAKACGYSSDTLLRLMATEEVMKGRSTEQVLKDEKYFMKEQSKDFVKNKQAEQDIVNTTVYFSKAGKKNAPEDGKIHNEIGNKGRALVQACPEMLCDEITDASQFNPKEDGAFTAQIDGKKRYFKFNQNKWKTFMGICCDPSKATDDAMKILFGNDQKTSAAFLKDLNLTLQEGRDVMQMSLPSPYGETGSVKFETAIGGKSDNTTSNKELNTLLHLAETAGYSADTNSTTGKRVLHFFKNVGLGGIMGAATGGVGSLLSGAVTVIGQTAGATASLTGPATLDYTDSVKTTDVTKTIIGGTTITEETVHNTAVKGTTTGDVTLTGHVDGQNYQDSGNNHWNNVKNAGILGGIAGAARGLATMRGVHAKGRSIDDVFNLTRLVENEKVEQGPLELKIPQFVEVQTRKGEMTIGTEIPKLKAVAYRGPAAYNGLYKYENGDPVSPRDFAKAYQNKINGNMTDFNFFVFSELEVPGKGKIVPVENYEDEYKKIKPGQPGGKRGVVYNGTGMRKLHAQGTIR